MKTNGGARRSYFDECGDYQAGVDAIVREMVEVYESDSIPWVVGYSGGKDSTATLQLVWLALQRLGAERAKKPVHIISTDTLVENPVVAAWVERSLARMNAAAKNAGFPITAHRLTPQIEDSFWVNLIGKGYPAPRQKFRWCTERMKIRPANRFISSMVDQHGETLLVLGIRKAESVIRASTMERRAQGRVRDKISPNSSLPNSFVYSPIENWSNDDVWMFLLETKNPWGHDNADLFQIYKGASPDNECPMVVDSSTPSCGDSRFGCWVCTLVEKDKSMQAMIQNNEDKKWMTPLLQIRAEIDFRAMSAENGDRHLRDYRRMNGQVQLFNGRVIPGPYKQSFREHLLKRVLETQAHVRRIGPDYMSELTLIQLAEMEEIRRIWVTEKHEIEDSLPGIYEKATGEKYPGNKLNDGLPFGREEMNILLNLCDGDKAQYQLTRSLISIGGQFSAKRHGVYQSLQRAVERHLYDGKEDAEAALEERENAIANAGQKRIIPLLPK